MKLLLDENLSFRLARALRDVFPGSAHLRDVWLRVGNASTDVIAKTLREHQQVIQQFVEDQDAALLVLDRRVLSDEVQ